MQVTNLKMNETREKILQLVQNDPNSNKELDKTDQEARKEIISNSSKRLSKSKKSYKATKWWKEKQLDQKPSLTLILKTSSSFGGPEQSRTSEWSLVCQNTNYKLTKEANLGQIF